MSLPQVLTGVAHIGIPTNDLDKTIAFYKKLGFVSALETVNKAAGERVAFLQLGDLMIETYENHRAAEKAGAIDHVALATTDRPVYRQKQGFQRISMLLHIFPDFADTAGRLHWSGRMEWRMQRQSCLPQDLP